MVDVRFEGDYAPQSPINRQQKNSRITQFFIDKSFGLITNASQAVVAQVIVSVLFFLIAGYFFSRSGDTVVPTKTPQELINATLPTNSRN